MRRQLLQKVALLLLNLLDSLYPSCVHGAQQDRAHLTQTLDGGLHWDAGRTYIVLYIIPTISHISGLKSFGLPLCMVFHQGRKEWLPFVALSFAIALSTTFTSLNRRQVLHNKEQPILNAIFCLEAAAIYIIYMVVSRIVSLALSCIEQSHPIPHHTYYETRQEDLHHLIHEDDEDDDELLWDEPPPPHHQTLLYYYARGIHREALISSMYLGGSGCFLALPALSFWDLSITAMLLLSLAFIALVAEHTKPVDFHPNQDKATVLLHLRRFRWWLYTLTFLLLLGLLYKDNQKEWLPNATPPPDQSSRRPIMLFLALVSPFLLRQAIPPSRKKQQPQSLMTPSQVLEAALPVSCLQAVLVLGWDTPSSEPYLQDTLFQDKPLALFIPMLALCPFCQVAILAFILRGFRQKQTLPLVIALTLTAVIVQQVMDCKLRH